MRRLKWIGLVALLLGGTFVFGHELGHKHARGHPAFIVWKLQTADSPADRRVAAVDLARLEDHRALLALIGSATMDLDPTVRNHCTGALNALKTPDAIPALIALLHDEALTVRATAAMGLARQGEAALPELRQVFLRGHPASCMFAAIAFSQIDSPGARAIFEEGAASESDEVRRWAVKLGQQGELERVLREVYGQVTLTEQTIPASEARGLDPELLMIGVRPLEQAEDPVSSDR